MANQERARQDLDWSSDLQPWDVIVETGRKLWGECRTWQILAVLAASVGQVDKVLHSSDLLDQTRPLCPRTVYASHRADDPNYWAAQLNSKTKIEDRRFLCLAFATLADIKVLVQYSERFSELLDTFGTKDWTWIYNTAQLCRWQGRVQRRRTSTVRMSDIPANISVRAACVLAMRADARSEALIYRKCLSQRLEEEPQVGEFAVRYSLDLKRFGGEKWNPDLEVLRRCYALGEHGHYAMYELSSKTRDVTRAMPLAIAQRILDSSTKYPSYLISAAVERYRAEVARGTTPVADIAERDNWFSH